MARLAFPFQKTQKQHQHLNLVSKEQNMCLCYALKKPALICLLASLAKEMEVLLLLLSY